MRRRVASILLACSLSFSVAGPAVPQSTGSSAVRAYYWNIGDGTTGGPAADSSRISQLRKLGVSEVHLWLNENRATPACGYLFRYQEGGVTLWTAGRLEQATRAFQAAGMKVVYTLSPDLRTRSYIASLAAPDGPLTVASRVGNVDVELDTEGNGSGPICPVDGLSVADADQLLLRTIRSTTPTSAIVVSTIRGYDVRHPSLSAGADVLSPQLYGAHYAYPLAAARSTLAYFRSRYPAKPLWLGLSVECSRRNAAAGRCSEALLKSEVELVEVEHAAQPALVPKYVIWGEREARQCPATPLCSVFAQHLLRARAGKEK